PYVSMEERLPLPRFSRPDQPLPDATARQLDELEEVLGHPTMLNWSERLRRQHLEQLHEHTVQLFVNRAGFGVGRMRVGSLSEWWRRRGLRGDPPIPQPGTRLTFAWSTEVLENQAPGPQPDELERHSAMHRSSVLDFVNPAGFGYVKDRRHVAGF